MAPEEVNITSGMLFLVKTVERKQSETVPLTLLPKFEIFFILLYKDFVLQWREEKKSNFCFKKTSYCEQQGKFLTLHVTVLQHAVTKKSEEDSSQTKKGIATAVQI